MKCRVRGIDMHFEEVGSGRPLLNLHGWGIGGGRMVMPFIEPLFRTRPGWRRLYPDLPGHGKTPVPPGTHGHDDVLDVVLEFIDAVAPGERFAVHGLSWGGYLARGVVYRRLKQLDGVMLSVPLVSWDADNSDMPAKQVVRSDPQFVAALRPDEQWLEDDIVVQSLALLDDLRSNVVANATPAQDPAIARLLEHEPFSFDPGELPEPCHAPALILTARQDHIAGYRAAWPILDNFPRGTFAVLDRSGHWLGIEQAALFRALATEWLDRVEEYAPDRVDGPVGR
jgi:pimeloyl-ACP methyl ester carboxylesterase